MVKEKQVGVKVASAIHVMGWASSEIHYSTKRLNVTHVKDLDVWSNNHVQHVKVPEFKL